MPRSRGSVMPQRESPRGPLQLRTSSSDSDQRSPKLGDHKSPRGTQSDPLNHRKLGPRISDVESQLGQAQDELKKLKKQLASVEAAKQSAQEQLENKTKKRTIPEPEEVNKVSDDNRQETDIFEVPVEKVTMEQPCIGICQSINEYELKITILSLVMKDEEISMLKAKLEDKEKEIQVFCRENERLKKELNEKTLEVSSAKAKAEEMNLKFNQVMQELKTSKNDTFEMNVKIEVTEKAREDLESEMTKLRVQIDQWRKAADAAAGVLAGEVEMNERRLSERCGSMDYKHYGNVFEPVVGGYGCYMGSPGMFDGSDDSFGHGKRKGSGIKMFGDLWRKKGQK